MSSLRFTCASAHPTRMLARLLRALPHEASARKQGGLPGLPCTKCTRRGPAERRRCTGQLYEGLVPLGGTREAEREYERGREGARGGLEERRRG
jgi:hypothetical protein